MTHRTTLSRKLSSLYDQIKFITMKMLQECDDASLSFDFWTDPNTSHSFGTLNLSIASFTKQTHSSSMEAQIRIVCLGAIRCKEAHTGPNIAVWTHNILQEYGCFSTNLCGIPRVLLSVATTDNGSNVINAVTQLQLLHMPCFAHTLSLCIQEALHDFPGLMESNEGLLPRLLSLGKLLNKSTTDHKQQIIRKVG